MSVLMNVSELLWVYFLCGQITLNVFCVYYDELECSLSVLSRKFLSVFSELCTLTNPPHVTTWAY